MNPITTRELDLIRSMRNQGLENYVIPGLESHLIGGNNCGLVRLFQCSRDHQEQITPHSHRFDFSALVLRGEVKNHIWDKTLYGDLYQKTTLVYDGKPGDYVEEQEVSIICAEVVLSTLYTAGDWYSMKADQIHSIEFSRDAMVMFFEGPKVADTSVILQPHVNGKTIPTFKTERWMFQPIVAA